MGSSLLCLSALLFILASPLVLAANSTSEVNLNSNLLQESIINKINANPSIGWKAGMNLQFSDYTVGQFKRILGARRTPQSEKRDIPMVSHPRSLDLPKEFDARKAWPQCSTIGNILDKGHCGSCWAFGAVETLQDRFCIHFGMNVTLSVNDLLACCGFMCGFGCDGGTPIYAWRYFIQQGVVTEECDPYFDTTGCSHPGCEPAYPTPKCSKKNVQTATNCGVIQSIMVPVPIESSLNCMRLWRKSTRMGQWWWLLMFMRILPITSPGFTTMKQGPTWADMGGHAVKLIGWGTNANGDDYWLLANQWNRSWGDDGYFKIKRGTNECGIEEDVVAVLPSTKNLMKVATDPDSRYASI